SGHRPYHPLTTWKRLTAQPDLWRNLQRVDPNIRVLFLVILNRSQRMVVETASKIETDSFATVLRRYSHQFNCQFSVICCQNYWHQWFVDSSLVHPSFSEAQLSVEISRRHVRCMLDSDEVETR